MKKIILKITSSIWTLKLRKRNTNLNPTIICNNCIAGVIYHDLGLKFNSPTINLSIAGKDYLDFVSDLKYYTTCKIRDVTPVDSRFPIGETVCDQTHRPIKINFQHYSSFNEAYLKWQERCKRINYDNMYVIWDFFDNLYDIELLKEFDNLPVKKIALIHKKFDFIKNAAYVSVYKDDIVYGKILQYNGLSGKRYLDEFDYVSFINS